VKSRELGPDEGCLEGLEESPPLLNDQRVVEELLEARALKQEESCGMGEEQVLHLEPLVLDVTGDLLLSVNCETSSNRLRPPASVNFDYSVGILVKPFGFAGGGGSGAFVTFRL